MQICIDYPTPVYVLRRTDHIYLPIDAAIVIYNPLLQPPITPFGWTSASKDAVGFVMLITKAHDKNENYIYIYTSLLKRQKKKEQMPFLLPVLASQMSS